MKDIELSIRSFRAVNSADIVLNGITVLSGVNSSGKSTISRLIYYVFKYANEFETIVDDAFYDRLEPISSLAMRLSYEIRDENGSREDFKRLYNIYKYDRDSKNRCEALTSLFRTASEILLQKNAKKSLMYRATEERYIRILKNILNEEHDKPLAGLFEEVIKHTQHIFGEMEKAIEERNYELFKHFIEDKIGESLENISIDEYNFPFVGKKVKNVPIMEYIRQVAYIDTPAIVGMDTPYWAVDYWENLDELLQKPATSFSQKNFDSIKDEIIHGETVYEGESLHSSYKYKREDGKIFDLFNSATGIKSFSVLQMLLNNGFISKNALLIIDEPEAHLHPQWIVEYARMIVLMHKHIGTKFVIASHSTDFVSAIKYIASKEECLSALSYYLSEKDSEIQFSYNYKSLGQDIEPIFESFNKSFELIDKYGANND